MKKFFCAIVLVLSSYAATAQQNIETRLGYTYTNDFIFSDEWQYLSTDIYLINGAKFNRVLNELEKGVKKPKKRYRLKLENLFISAQLNNLKLFGNDAIVYPLYNFSVKANSQEYTTQVSDHMEVVRIIDKMPLSSTEKSIDAVISAKAITGDETGQMFDLVANQLLSLSKLTTPTGAVLSLIGEYGNLLNSRTKKKEYKFSSTIRLYEGQDFDTRLHSVKVYVFVPGEVKAVTIKTSAKIAHYLANNPSKLDRKQLESVIGYSDYPYMVVANYKSLYKMDVLTGDEVTPDLIEKRKQKIENAYASRLVNDETYRQEKVYVEFLRIFAEMKQNLNIYRLNYRNNNPDVNAKNLFAIIQDYKRMYSTFDAREKEYAENTTYQRIFRQEYQSILNNADLYLEADHNLKSGKMLVSTLREMEKDPGIFKSAEKREAALARLYAVELPKPSFLSASVEGEAVLLLIKRLEDQQFKEVFEHDIKKLSEAQASDETVIQRNSLQEKANASKCNSCREKVRETVAEYNKRYELFKLGQSLKKKVELNQTTEQAVFKYLKEQQCIAANLQERMASGNGQELYLNRIQEKNKELAAAIQLLDQQNKKEPDETRLSSIQNYNQQLQTLLADVVNNYQIIYAQDKSLCNCPEPSW